MSEEQNKSKKKDSKSVSHLFGLLHQPGMRPLTIEERKEAIARFHAEENERILNGRLSDH